VGRTRTKWKIEQTADQVGLDNIAGVSEGSGTVSFALSRLERIQHWQTGIFLSQFLPCSPKRLVIIHEYDQRTKKVLVQDKSTPVFCPNDEFIHFVIGITAVL
jgi:hypothetical protein